MDTSVIPRREQMLDDMGRPLTQSIFLEIGYSDAAIYTLKEIDHEHKGKVYPSLKRLFLEMGDPTEYEFATTYLLGWKHWQRMCDNKLLNTHFEEWRQELEIKLRSKAVKDMINAAKDGNYSASKWLADRGWSNKGAGRPTKADIEGTKKILARTNDEYSSDIVRLNLVK